VSGTLTEMEAELESVRHVIAGIGVNLNAPADAFPAGLRDRVTSLAIASRRRIDRAAFTGRLLAELERWYGRFVAEGFAPLRPAWERWSALDGATVTVSGPDGDVAGTVVGLADDGALRVAGADGRERRVVAGEVTVRRAHGPARGRRLVLPRR
jgi:BirA family biotin operon repressor/biotin-[acetyl-CoA-carboxylase] ligase